MQKNIKMILKELINDAHKMVYQKDIIALCVI